MRIPESVRTYGLIAILIVSSFLVAAQFIDPAPPRSMIIAAGSPAGDYYRYAQAYRERLAEDGITAEILETAGSSENARMLQEGRADVAFIQSGIATPSSVAAIQSLGSLYLEPLWVFMRIASDEKDLKTLEGKTVSLGASGSGTEAIAQTLIDAVGIDVTDSGLSGQGAVDALLAGEIDALFIVGTVTNKRLLPLISNDKLSLLSFGRADAYTRTFPYLSKVQLAEGIFNLATNLPAHDVTLVSPVAQLAVRSDLNGALKSLLVAKTHAIHGAADIFSDRGTFPSPRYVDFPLAEEAVIYFDHGPGLFQRLLPFWVADTLNRMVVMLIPLIGVMFPLIKIASPAYKWRTRSKIYKWYRGLNQTEEAAQSREAELDEALAQLDHIDREVKKTDVPLSYAEELYNLRQHIRLIRERIEKKRE